MPQKKHPVVAPPPEWVSLLDEHEDELVRVRLLWRTGSSKYRPVVPITADFESLESASDNAWEALELNDTHFNWLRTEGESPSERQGRLEGAASRLWNFSRRFARALDQRCDFQLRGYGNDDEVLFESGARFNPNTNPVRSEGDGEDRSASPHTPPPGPTAGAVPPAWSRTSLEEEERRIHGLKDELIKRLTEERNRTDEDFRNLSQQSPTLITHAGEILKEAIGYQARVVEELVSQRTGDVEVRVRAFAEEQETRREALRLEWRRYAMDTVLGNLVPLASTVFDAWANRPTNNIAQFEFAQQAIAYLGMTLNESQLSTLFNGSHAAIQNFGEILQYSASQAEEREAIHALKGLEVLFRSQRFRDVADPEQQLAARFILARAALYRVDEL